MCHQVAGGSKAKTFTGGEDIDKAGGVGMLLRCFRIMENATFLSELNQVFCPTSQAAQKHSVVIVVLVAKWEVVLY